MRRIATISSETLHDGTCGNDTSIGSSSGTCYIMKASQKDKQRRLRHARCEKHRRERQYAADARDAKRYYQVPAATPPVLARLVSWRKGERCKEFDRANRWATFDEAMMQHQMDAMMYQTMLSGAQKYGPLRSQSLSRSSRQGGKAVHISQIDFAKLERRILERMHLYSRPPMIVSEDGINWSTIGGKTGRRSP